MAIDQKFLHKGDLVVFEKTYFKNDQWPIAPGTKGTVIKKWRLKDFCARWGYTRDWYQAGVYEYDDNVVVRWDDGFDTELLVDSNKFTIGLVDKKLEKRRMEEWTVLINRGFTTLQLDNQLLNRVRIGDLPETKFYELDVVRYTGPKKYNNEQYQMRIKNIAFGDDIDEREYYYWVEWIDENGLAANVGETGIYERDLELICRGNIWKEFHNEPLEFFNLLEEYHYSMGTGRHGKHFR